MMRSREKREWCEAGMRKTERTRERRYVKRISKRGRKEIQWLSTRQLSTNSMSTMKKKRYRGKVCEKSGVKKPNTGWLDKKSKLDNNYSMFVSSANDG